MKKINSTKQINRSYHSHIKKILKGEHERDIFDSLSAGKNAYLRLDRLASSSFDKSWIEVIEGCIFDLGEIIANPRLNTKIEGSITPVELARKVNSETVQHLASHTQYIKEVDEYGNVIPSKLLSMYADDDIHTYENRFIATFVRRLMLFITKRYEYVTKYAELRNEEYLYFKNKSIVDGAEVEIETKVKVSYKNDDEQAQINSGYVERIKQTRDYIMYFYNSPFMKAMKNEKDVRNPILQTNIIRKNLKYHHCYEVYRFIETYDKLGVNYKIDENYSMFNEEELNELNRTLFANYITLKGKDMSKSVKTNSKVYKPRILTSSEDESFIYGPLLEGPIEFARVDEGYKAYLDSKLRKDLPLHPTKKEKEYYQDEYAAKAERRQDEKQLNDLMKRRQKEVNAFEKSVKNILIKREEARLRLLELEKETIKQEENDLLEAARREIIEASKLDVADHINKKEEKAAADKPKSDKPALAENPVTFDEAANDVFAALNNPTPIEEQPSPVTEEVVEEPVLEDIPAEEVSVEAEQPVEEQPAIEPAPVVEETPVEEQPIKDSDEQVIPDVVAIPATPVEEEPTIKEEEEPIVVVLNENAEQTVKVPEEGPADASAEYVKVESPIFRRTTFEDAMLNVWPQLKDNEEYISTEQRELQQELEAHRLAEQAKEDELYRQQEERKEQEQPAPVTATAKKNPFIKPVAKKPFIIPKKKKKPFVIPTKKKVPFVMTPKKDNEPVVAKEESQKTEEPKKVTKPFKGIKSKNSRKGFRK